MRKNKRNKKQTSAGITLISLVITIIVLLILAGVSISLVFGNNGIINQAQEASEKIQEEEVKESRELDWLAIEAERLANPSKSQEEQIQWITDYLDKKGTVTLYKIEDNGTKNFTYESDNGDESYRFEVDSEGKMMLDILANKITVENYGDKVNYNPNAASGVNLASEDTMEWRIFYTEGDNVFIIASDYVPHSLINKEKTGIIPYSDAPNYPAPIKWGSNIAFQSMTQQSLFKATGYTLQSKYQNSRWTSTLLNTDNWTQFVDSTKASYAIGSPTIEMWIASWNDKYNDNLAFGISKTGYKVGINTLGDSIDAATMSAKPGYQDAMYYPHKGEAGGAYGYFLASPGANNSNSMVRVVSDGMIGHDNYTDYALRPIVCLKKTTTGDKTDGVWVLE